jgi:hypothetical protein
MATTTTLTDGQVSVTCTSSDQTPATGLPVRHLASVFSKISAARFLVTAASGCCPACSNAIARFIRAAACSLDSPVS